MKRLCIVAIAIATSVLSTASATMIRQEWHTGVGASRQAIIDFLEDLANPVPPPDLEEIQDLSSFTGTRDNYVAKFYGWVTVPATGTYQFHYSCDDYGMLYVSQDEEMANAEEVAWVDGWAAIAEWNKYPTQHSATMPLKKGQVMAVMAFFQEAGGGDNMDVGWTGPGLSQDGNDPTYLTDYITHIPPTPTKAKNPTPPVDDPDVQRDTDLAWKPGKFATTHTVYLSTNFNDVNDAAAAALIADGITGSVFDPGRLEFGATYYWRVDEVNSPPDSTVFAGKTWSFTVEPRGYPVEGVTVTASSEASGTSLATNLLDGSGLTDGLHGVDAATMWLAAAGVPAWLEFDLGATYKLDSLVVWNQNQLIEAILGFGAKDVVVETSTDGTTWSPVEGATLINQGPGAEGYAANTTLDMGGVTASHVRITISSGHGFIGQVGLAEVQILFIPTFATRPNPDSGATDVAPDTALSWGRNGREADRHEVYVGADPDNLALAGGVSESSFDTLPLDLQLGQSYSWRVDEVNEAMDPSTWEGPAWSFTTADTISIDDMESYADAEFLEIWATWVDGFDDPANGSLVGIGAAGSPETGIVHGGRQSLPMDYGIGAAALSEATRTFDAPMNWTLHGVQSLSLYFQGASDNSGGQLYVKIGDTKIVYDGPAVNITRPSWQLWNIDLSTVGNVSNIRSLTIGVEGPGAQGVLYIDDIQLHPEVLEDASPDITGAGDTVQGVPNDGNWPAAETPDLAIDDNSNTKFLHFAGATEPSGFQVTPLVGAAIVTEVTFTTANDATERDPVTFELYGSNASIDGPYTLIASGDIIDFAQTAAWPRFTKTETAITFANDVAYTHFQVLFPTVRTPGSANSMQIAEVELIGTIGQ